MSVLTAPIDLSPSELADWLDMAPCNALFDCDTRRRICLAAGLPSSFLGYDKDRSLETALRYLRTPRQWAAEIRKEAIAAVKNKLMGL